MPAADNSTIYYAKQIAGNWQIWMVPASGQEAAAIVGQEGKPVPVAHRFWAPSQEGIYFVPALAHPTDAARRGMKYRIDFFQFSTKRITPVLVLDKPPSQLASGGLSFSPVRRWILFTQQDQEDSDLMLVENFY
jgi:hypothetical protein